VSPSHRRHLAFITVLASLFAAAACSSEASDDATDDPGGGGNEVADAGKIGTGRDASTSTSDDAASSSKDAAKSDASLVIDGGAGDDAAPSSSVDASAPDASGVPDAGGTADAGADAGPPKLTLTWDDNSQGEDGFAIDRKIGAGGTYAEIATVPANVTTYVDYAVSRGVTYCYQVRAFNDAGSSAPSAEACAAPK